jgi:pimeloyl-ACP methyl ester carboxylesterase
MNKNGRRAIFAIVLIACAALTLACGEKKPQYRILHEALAQPVDHGRTGGPIFSQQVDVLVPATAPADAPVFFNLGNEHDLTDRDIEGLYRAYGSPADVIFIQAEHRGYGQSVTADADQSIPRYVTVSQALADFHRVIAEYKKRYPGPWMGSGYSYGGGLVINFAAKYPDDLTVVLSSSGVVDWPFQMDAYDRGVRRTFGEKAYTRLAEHIRNLEPKQPFDNNWLEREFLIALIHGATQYERYKGLLPVVNLLAKLPTSYFIRVLHWIDGGIAGGGAWAYASSNAKKTLTRDEALAGVWGWRLWRYQQCTETGVFEVSVESPGIFTRTRPDFIAECSALFGEAPAAREPEWSPRAMVRDLKIPLVYVAGGMDPWMGLCLEEKNAPVKGRYFYVPGGRHCPDHGDDPALSKEVLAEMLKWARERSAIR